MLRTILTTAWSMARAVRPYMPALAVFALFSLAADPAFAQAAGGPANPLGPIGDMVADVWLELRPIYWFGLAIGSLACGVMAWGGNWEWSRFWALMGSGLFIGVIVEVIAWISRGTGSI